MLTTLDWGVIIGFLLLIIALGLSYGRQSGKSLEAFFLGNRKLPWWLAGLSMVATTFAADTPLAVAELVGQNGVSGNWLWWNFLAGGMLTTFFFAPLWQRSGVLTEVEFVELRYSGPAARFLRGFKAIYLGLFLNIIILAWVNLAMSSLLQGIFGLTEGMAFLYTLGLLLLGAVYSAVAGLLGVAVTDALQFVVAILGCIILAYVVLDQPEIGGLEGLTTQLKAVDPALLDFFPSTQKEGSGLYFGISSFIAYLGILWWASWYPGAEPGGGGYTAQRMMSTGSEKAAQSASLLFQMAHYCLRPWPWILVGLAAILLYALPPQLPEGPLKQQYNQYVEAGWTAQEVLDEKAELSAKSPELLAQLPAFRQALTAAAAENPKLASAIDYQLSYRQGYVMAMRDFLPPGLLGLLLVAFLAAYLSTVSTQLNWGAGYLVHDFYKRFLQPQQTEGHYVWISRLLNILLALAAAGISLFIEQISGAWAFILQAGAGLGLLLILRWYWWRINAWAELTAMIAPALISIPFFYYEVPFEEALPTTVLFTTISWLLVMIFTPATDQKVLQAFYQKVRPLGDWSGLGIKSNNRPLLSLLGQWLAAIVLTYSLLFAVGKLLFLVYAEAAIFGGTALLALLVLYLLQRKK